MSKFKDLIIDILEMYERGRTVAEIATALQLGRSVVEYVIDTYAEVLQDWQRLGSAQGSVVCSITKVLLVFYRKKSLIKGTCYFKATLSNEKSFSYRKSQ